MTNKLPTPDECYDEWLNSDTGDESLNMLIEFRDKQILARLEAKRKAYCYCVAEGSQCDVCELIYSLQDELRGGP